MDCQTLRTRLAAGALEPTPALEAHARACPACAAVVEDAGAVARALLRVAPGDAPSPDELHGMEERLAERLAADRGWLGRVRARPRWQRMAAWLAVLAALVIVVAFAFPRRPFAEGAATRFALAAVGPVVLLALASWRSLRPLHLPPPSRAVTLALLLAAAAAPALLAVFPPELHVAPASPQGDELAAGLACAALGALVAGVACAVGLALVRSFPLSGRTAALLGAGAGLGALLGLELHCHRSDALHLFAAHAALAWLSTALAAMFAFLVAVRARPRG